MVFSHIKRTGSSEADLKLNKMQSLHLKIIFLILEQQNDSEDYQWRISESRLSPTKKYDAWYKITSSTIKKKHWLKHSQFLKFYRIY